jgi:hypothetical protein
MGCSQIPVALISHLEPKGKFLGECNHSSAVGSRRDVITSTSRRITWQKSSNGKSLSSYPKGFSISQPILKIPSRLEENIEKFIISQHLTTIGYDTGPNWLSGYT